MKITNTNDIISKIDEAELVLVGIGEEWQVSIEEMLENETFREKYDELHQLDDAKKQYELQFLISDYYKNEIPNRLKEAYETLADLLKNKNYYVVTLMMDDYISHSDVNCDNMVAPCGNFKALQCGENCANMLYEEVDIVSHVCEKCGSLMYYNNIYAPKYNEDGYLPQWERYMKWLQGTVNKKTVLLELGVGIIFPSVIRWPFEKTVTYNQKANLIRINKKLSMLPENMSERGYSLQKDSVDTIIACKNTDISL